MSPVSPNPRKWILDQLLRLAQGKVQQRTCEDVQRLIPLLRLDPKIDIVETLQGLLVTETHILVRFDKYGLYPGKALAYMQGTQPSWFCVGYPSKTGT